MPERFIMSRKYLILLIIAGFVSLLIGCHAGGSAPFAPNNGETVVTPETRIVDAKGRFDDITFPSGAVIKCPNDNTFQEGVKVTASEDKIPVITDNSGNFSYIYQYRISAVLPSENSLTADVPVNTTEKPLKVSFPNNSTTGFCYIGTRASENDPWRYTLADDGGVGNLRLSRLSIKSPKAFYFDLYRFNIQFRLFVIDNEDSDKAEVDFVEVSTGSKENKISIENGKYAEDLEVKITLYGEKLDSINTNNLTARIIYRSNNLNPVQIKANGSIVKQNDSDDKAVTGGYEHSFEISNIRVDSQMSGEAVLSFVLNLNGVTLEDFPTDFLVEFYSDTKDEKALPFIYTRVLSFETKENQNDPDPQPQPDPDSQLDPDPDPQPVTTYTIAYDLDGGEPTGNNPTSYNENTGDIPLSNPTKEGYTFTGWTGTELDAPTENVVIKKGSTGNRSYKANWKQNAPDEYTLNLGKGDGIATVSGNGAYKAGENITASCTMLAGYEFDKWTGDFTEETFTMPANNATMTANAKLIEYKISYVTEGGVFSEGVASPTLYTVASEAFTLPTPTKNNCVFVDWVIDGGAPVKSVTIAQGTHESRTYVASWTMADTLTFTLAEGVTLEMKRCPAGTFTMGSPTTENGRFDDETQHSVTISKDFWMGTYEVTQAQYRAIMGSNPSDNTTGDESVLPVERVTWNDIMTESTGFNAMLNASLTAQLDQLPGSYKFDLPTEAQWEYACRAGTTSALNNGKKIVNLSSADDNLSEVAWYYYHYENTRKTHTVGSLASNTWGLYDMHGNVWEWCKDMYADYPTTAVTDPFCDTGSNRVFRGGGWDDLARLCRSAWRGGNNPGLQLNLLGFRLALVPVVQ